MPAKLDTVALAVFGRTWSWRTGIPVSVYISVESVVAEHQKEYYR